MPVSPLRQTNIVSYPIVFRMRSLVILVPVAMAIGFIPFGTLLEETVGSGPLFLVAMILYVVLFPLSPKIIGFFLAHWSGVNEPISQVESPNVGDHRTIEDLDNESPHSEVKGWWKPDPPENHGYQ